MIKKFLQTLGFSEKEIKLYVALLELGRGTPTEISRKTNLNRTTVYDIVRVLMDRGLISKFKKGSSTYFYSRDPKQLLAYLEREKQESVRKFEKQQKRLTELLPEFVSLENLKKRSRPRVQFFEGEKGVREAYEDTLTSSGTIYAYTNVQAMIEGLPNFFPDYWKRRAKKKIPIHAVFVDNTASRERAKFNQEELRQTKFLEKGKEFSPEVKIYNDKMLIASWKEKIAVIVESGEFIKLQKTIFEELWKRL